MFARLTICVGLWLSCSLGACADDGGRTHYILAASWQPAFCQENSKKPECAGQTADRHDAVNFSLHGLWPMRQTYCGVSEADQANDKSRKWTALPEVELSPAGRADLAKVMPGVQSGLDRHEWTKHGICTRMGAQTYFNTAVRLIAELNGSPVQKLFAENVGKTLSASQIKAAFDEGFGSGASDRVKMSCRRQGGKRLISELTIGLSQDAVSDKGESLKTLMKGAGRTGFGCDAGVVDAAGF